MDIKRINELTDEIKKLTAIEQGTNKIDKLSPHTSLNIDYHSSPSNLEFYSKTNSIITKLNEIIDWINNAAERNDK